MTQKEKDDIVEKAKRDYPNGTRHSGYAGREGEYTSSGEFAWSGDLLYAKKPDAKHAHDTLSGCIYKGDSKTWAKIFSNPVTKEPEYEIY